MPKGHDCSGESAAVCGQLRKGLRPSAWTLGTRNQSTQVLIAGPDQDEVIGKHISQCSDQLDIYPFVNEAEKSDAWLRDRCEIIGKGTGLERLSKVRVIDPVWYVVHIARMSAAPIGQVFRRSEHEVRFAAISASHASMCPGS